MDRFSYKRDNFLRLQNYKVQIMFITLPVRSAKKPRKKEGHGGWFGVLPHTHKGELSRITLAMSISTDS